MIVSRELTQSETVHVATLADERAVLPLAVMMHGVAQNAGVPGVTFHVLGVNLSDQLRRQLEKAVEGSRVVWLDERDARRMIDELPHVAHIPPISYTRLLLPDLLPDLDQVLYLDADLVVKANVGELWDGGTDGQAVAAVADPGMPTLGHAHCVGYAADELVDPDARPFNAGVMLMDLARWRAEGIAAKVLDFLRRHASHLNWADQERAQRRPSERLGRA